MDFLGEGVGEAIGLLFGFDGPTYRIVGFSLGISLLAVLLAAAVGIPLAGAIGLGRFRGRGTLAALAHGSMAVPSVFVGLLLYGLFSRLGPLGPLDLLYTPAAVAIGQAALALPLVLALGLSAVETADARAHPTAISLGLGRFRAVLAVLGERRAALAAAVAAAFARAITEVGCALIVGGNIKDKTSTMTTSIATEVGKGEFARALALGLVLLIVALTVLVLFRKAVPHD